MGHPVADSDEAALVSEMIAPLRSDDVAPGDRAVLATSVVISFVPVVKPLKGI
jgi:hypothetical protein